MITLFLDTTIAKKAKVKLEKDSHLVCETENDSPLIAIKEALAKAQVSLTEIDTFESNPGPGSYTGVRVGAAVVNALNFALGKKAAVIEPIYQ